MGITDRLQHRMSVTVREFAEAEARRVLELAKADVPVGDPAEDPDPSLSLADTGHVDVTVLGGRVVATVTFDAPYATKQHEDQHLKHPRGGRSKFLETHVQHAAATFAAELGVLIGRDIHG